MSDVCRSLGISRKTGYKIFNRYKEQGLEALTDRCRRPVRYANQLPPQIEGLIVTLKRESRIGARARSASCWCDGSIRTSVSRLKARSTPSCTGTAWSKGRAGPRHRAQGTPLSAGAAPNDLWCVDFKGEFKLGNGQYCYPLTVTDHASRFLLLCEALDSTRETPAITAFEQFFRERGLPAAIRSDNGVRRTTARSSSPPAVASACTENASISPASSPAKSSESRKSTTVSGSSPSCTTISDLST